MKTTNKNNGMRERGEQFRTEIQLAEDLALLCEKRKIGWSYRRIGAHINSIRDYELDHVIYYRQYMAFVSPVLKQAAADKDELINIQLSEIEELKTEALNSWYESKGEKLITTTKNVSDEEIEEVKKEWEEVGNVSYLTLYEKLMVRESKLLGLDAPTKQEVTGADGKDLFNFEIVPASRYVRESKNTD